MIRSSIINLPDQKGLHSRISPSSQAQLCTNLLDLNTSQNSCIFEVLQYPFTIYLPFHPIGVVIPNASSPALVWTGVSNRHIGKLAPKSSLGLELSLIPRVPGLHSISGLRILDTFLKRTYEHDDIAQVLVICKDPDDPALEPASVDDIQLEVLS